MRKFALFFILSLIVFSFVLWRAVIHKPIQPKSKNIVQKMSRITPITHKSLFVPYWEISSGLYLPKTSYGEVPDTLIYFAITPDENSINKNEAGFDGISKFLQQSSSFIGKKLITIRLTNDTVSRAVLSDQRAANAIMNEAISVADSYGFDGLVLDLEVGGFATEKITNQISVFARIAGSKLHAKNMSFGMTIYGDTLYRARPYDLRDLGEQVDMLYIMAYDLHKTIGTPGPNFPLRGAARFGYDMQNMVAEISALVPAKKLTVIFGMYGYDWWVDEKKRAITRAKPLTLSQIRRKFLQNCDLQNCVVRRDQDALETEVNYVDNAGGLHIVWFEDEESTEQKVQFLQTKGIGSYAIWGAGYY